MPGSTPQWSVGMEGHARKMIEVSRKIGVKKAGQTVANGIQMFSCQRKKNECESLQECLQCSKARQKFVEQRHEELGASVSYVSWDIVEGPVVL